MSNELGDLAESKVLKERSAAQEAERADKEAAENLSIAYSQERQKLMLWLDQVDEAVSEDLTELDSVELVTDQRNLWVCRRVSVCARARVCVCVCVCACVCVSV